MVIRSRLVKNVQNYAYLVRKTLKCLKLLFGWNLKEQKKGWRYESLSAHFKRHIILNRDRRQCACVAGNRKKAGLGRWVCVCVCVCTRERVEWWMCVSVCGWAREREREREGIVNYVCCVYIVTWHLIQSWHEALRIKRESERDVEREERESVCERSTKEKTVGENLGWQ